MVWSGTEPYGRCNCITIGANVSIPAFEPEEEILFFIETKIRKNIVNGNE